MLKRLLLLSFCLVVSLTILNCNNNKSSDESDDATTQPSTPSSTSSSAPIPTPPLIPTPTGTYIRTENVTIDDTNNWLNNLGINWGDNNALIVNAANKELAGGGGIDGALISWAQQNGITTPWNNNPDVKELGADGVCYNVTSVNPGEFAFLRVNGLGVILLAVGPKASEVTTLEDTSKMVENLYFDILELADTAPPGKKVVLCAVSTGIYADSDTESVTGKSFTKEQFLRYVWNGIHKGIIRFQTDNPGSSLEIILNNWNPS